jgi:hypothetical protein
MTSAFVRKLASSFETGQSIRSIQQAVRNEWSGNWRDRATLYNADHGANINPSSFNDHCRFLGSRRTLVETLADIFHTYLANRLSADMVALHERAILQASCSCTPPFVTFGTAGCVALSEAQNTAGWSAVLKGRPCADYYCIQFLMYCSHSCANCSQSHNLLCHLRPTGASPTMRPSVQPSAAACRRGLRHGVQLRPLRPWRL